MMTFIANVMDKNGNVPNVGDADDGYGFKISSYFSEPFTAHLSIGSVLFKRGDFKLKIRKYDEKSFWLLGKDSIDSFHKINIEKGTGIKQYPSGGYYILSMKEETENEIKLVFDCGEQGYLSIAAHGHADALSFTLSVGGSLFLIDPGTFAYHTNKEWREYFRNSSAHNTVVIDGRSQAITGGAFLWSRKVKASFISCAFSDDKDCVAAEHDGYLFLKDPVRHIREICLDKIQRRIKVIDTLKCRKRHKIEQYFHFASECRVEKKYANEFVVDNNGGRIAIWTDTKFLSVVMKGEDQPIIGWESKKYDTKLPSSTLINSGWVDGDIVLTTEIQC
jgi:hypothetical protein